MNVHDQIVDLSKCAMECLQDADDMQAVFQILSEYTGPKGKMRAFMASLKSLNAEDRKSLGKIINDAVGLIENAAESRRDQITKISVLKALQDSQFDPTLPGKKVRFGSLHPVTIIERRLQSVFERMGFLVLDYPEVDSEQYNFEKLNIPKDHPARDMQDTFWLENGFLLRTHTSAGQVRTMERFKPPFRVIFPGKVFRYEATDASHEHTFHQVEGLLVDREASVANLIASMKTLLSEVFEREVKVRLRPGYFPFVEPGFELDISCLICGGQGCSVCKRSGWVELLPCGLVHPAVLRAGGLDPAEWQGWAFGLGLSRLIMMRFGIDDVRRILASRVDFLEQFVAKA